MIWLVAVFGVLVAYFLLKGYLLSRGTLYFIHGRGFRALKGPEQEPHRVSSDLLLSAIDRLIFSGKFDALWVSWSDNRYSGIMLANALEGVELSVSFKTNSQQTELAAFKDSMSVLMEPSSEDYDSFNGGSDEEHRITSLDYTLAKSSLAVLQATELAIAALSGSPADSYFISGSRWPSGLGRRGIKFVASEDPLADLFL